LADLERWTVGTLRAAPSYLEGWQISENHRQTRIGHFNPSEES
jgi:hypothetical protein